MTKLPILSIVIPAHNEEACLGNTVRALYKLLSAENIPCEILVINDNSRDTTEDILKELMKEVPALRYINNNPPNGFGFAVRCGLENYKGDAVAVYMADASDRPEDLVKYYRAMVEEDVDCVFGTRFSPSSKVVDYPWPKLALNRLANLFIQIVFGLGYNDVTNAFKLYKRDCMNGLKPFISHHFNLTVELPLKAIIRHYTYTVVPNDWYNRKAGESKLKIKEMGSRYLFIVLYCFIERWLSRGDYLYKPVKSGSNRSHVSLASKTNLSAKMGILAWILVSGVALRLFFLINRNITWGRFFAGLAVAVFAMYSFSAGLPSSALVNRFF